MRSDGQSQSGSPCGGKQPSILDQQACCLRNSRKRRGHRAPVQQSRCGSGKPYSCRVGAQPGRVCCRVGGSGETEPRSDDDPAKVEYLREQRPFTGFGSLCLRRVFCSFDSTCLMKVCRVAGMDEDAPAAAVLAANKGLSWKGRRFPTPPRGRHSSHPPCAEVG